MRLRPLATWTTGLVLALVQAGLAQVVVPAPSGRAPGGQADLNNLVHQMAERVRHLGEDIDSDLAQTPQGRHLIQDTQELAEAVEAFHETLHGRPDPARAGQAFAAIDGTWNHLKAQLARPGVSSPAVVRAARRVDELDAQIRQVLGLNIPPPGPSPDLNRVVHEMAERVRHLGEDIGSDLAQTPQGRHLIEDTRELAGAVDGFHEALHNVRDPDQLRQAYRGIDETWHHVRAQLARPGISSPAVDRAARRVDELDAQIHQALGLRPAPQPTFVPAAPAPGVPGPAPAPPFAPAPLPPGAAVSWSGPREVARAAGAFARAVENLEEAIQDVSEDSPLAGVAERLAESADRLREAVRGGAPYERAVRDFRAIEQSYGRFGATLNRYHIVHHDEELVRRSRDVQAAFDRLLAQMSGRRD